MKPGRSARRPGWSARRRRATEARPAARTRRSAGWTTEARARRPARSALRFLPTKKLIFPGLGRGFFTSNRLYDCVGRSVSLLARRNKKVGVASMATTSCRKSSRVAVSALSRCRAQLHVSERRACAALGQHRSTQRKVPRGRDDDRRLTADIIELARQYGRYRYRKVAALLRQAGWTINDKRVERIWQREGLKVPHKQPKRGRLWLADGSCIRLRRSDTDSSRTLFPSCALPPAT